MSGSWNNVQGAREEVVGVATINDIAEDLPILLAGLGIGSLITLLILGLVGVQI